MKAPFPLPLQGIIPPMVTPLLPDKTLDKKGVQKMVEHLISGGVHGIFILGTTGESASLSLEIREGLIEEVLSCVAKRIPVLVGITDPSQEVSLQLADKASVSGASALVSAPPFYYLLGQKELINYYRKLADRLPLPLFLYNMPSHTKIVFDLNSVIELSKHPNIIGLKDSSANAPYFQKILYCLKDNRSFSLLVGPEEILAETVLMGGNGGVSGGANMFPKLYVDLYRAASEKNFSRLLLLQEKVMQISCSLYSVGADQSSYLKGLKSALSFLGLIKDVYAEPIFPFTDEENGIIRERVIEIQKSLSQSYTALQI